MLVVATMLVGAERCCRPLGRQTMTTTEGYGCVLLLLPLLSPPLLQARPCRR